MHKAFVEYIQLFDENTRKEWIDERKRAYHIEIIKDIQKEESLTFKKAMLLYFVIYNKRNIIEEKLKENITDELKQLSIEKLLEEIVGGIASDLIPMGNTMFKISKFVIKKIKNNTY